MAKIFLADSDFYIIADNMDQAVEKFYEDKVVYPTTVSLFKDSSFVITESTVVEVSTGILPALAEVDGASVSPTPNVFIKEGDSITLIATPSVGYPNFVNWTIDSVEISTDSTFTYTAGTSAVSIVANFSA